MYTFTITIYFQEKEKNLLLCIFIHRKKKLNCSSALRVVNVLFVKYPGGEQGRLHFLLSISWCRQQRAPSLLCTVQSHTKTLVSDDRQQPITVWGQSTALQFSCPESCQGFGCGVSGRGARAATLKQCRINLKKTRWVLSFALLLHWRIALMVFFAFTVPASWGNVKLIAPLCPVTYASRSANTS